MKGLDITTAPTTIVVTNIPAPVLNKIKNLNLKLKPNKYLARVH